MRSVRSAEEKENKKDENYNVQIVSRDVKANSTILVLFMTNSIAHERDSSWA